MNRQRRHGMQVIAVLFVFCSTLGAQSNPAQIEQYSGQAQQALAAGDLPQAQQAYEKLRELKPNVAEVHANLGLIYFREALFEEAAASFRKALVLKPALAATRVLLALSLAELGEYNDALPTLEKVFRDPAAKADVKRMCGLELMRAFDNLNRESDAVKVGIVLNQAYPNDPEILYQTGRVYANFAFVTMRRLAQVAPNSVWRWLEAGEAEQSAGNFTKALVDYRAVLQMDPRHRGIHYRIGRILEAQSQQSTSSSIQAELNEFEEELRIDPVNANAAYESGVLCSRAGQFDKAEEFFEEALKYHPDFEEAQVGLGGVLVDAGKPALAIPHLRKATELDPKDEVPYYQLTQAYKALGNTEEAREALSHFQQLQTLQASEDERLQPGEDITRQTVDRNRPKQF